MNRIKPVVTLCAGLFISLSALAAPPSNQSIEKLLSVSETDKQVIGMQKRTELDVLRSLDHEVSVRDPKAMGRSDYANFKKNVIGGYIKQLSWEKMKPFYVQGFAKTMSQDEVDTLIKLYSSPEGKLALHKFPEALGTAVSLQGSTVAPIMQQMGMAMRDYVLSLEPKKGPSQNPGPVAPAH